MTLDHKRDFLEGIRGGMSLVVYPVHVAVDSPGAIGSWVLENLASRQALITENASLRAQHLLLKGQLQKLAALEVENIRLRNLLDSAFKISDKVLVAELLSADLEPFTRKIVVNKGTSHSVFLGQAVIDAEGIVGQVVHLSPINSTIMLITDPSSSIPVQVNRNGLRGIANGTGAMDALELINIPNNADIQNGDLLISSGLGGRYPANYPVAKVIQIRQDPSKAYATVLAKPMAQLSKMREVLMILARKDKKGELLPPTLQKTPESKKDNDESR